MMKYLGRLVMMAMLAAAMVIPGLAGTAFAQGGAVDLCNQARDAGTGSAVAGLPVVWLTGGSGNQIVLGPDDGGAWLSGGSGNDVLCAWGSGNTLDGGSGNDVLVAPDGGNTFLGGSGNDTMIGVDGDIFDGGSGSNAVELLLPIINDITFDISFATVPPGAAYCRLTATVDNLDPARQYTVALYWNDGVTITQPLIARSIGPGITSYVYAPIADMLNGSMTAQVVVGDTASDWVLVTC